MLASRNAEMWSTLEERTSLFSELVESRTGA
jgi:hypothetical protein